MQSSSRCNLKLDIVNLELLLESHEKPSGEKEYSRGFMDKQHSTTITDTVADKQWMVHASDRKFLQGQVNNAWYTRPTVTDMVESKQCIEHASGQKFPGRQVCFDQSIATDQYSGCRCLQSEIRMKNRKHKRVIPTSLIMNRQAWSKIVAPHFQLWKHHFSESYNRVECNYILKSGKKFGRNTTSRYHHSYVNSLFPVTLRDNIGTNEIHVRCIQTIWFCPVEFNSTYLTNKNGVFPSPALDTFGKIRLIQVSSIVTYGNKRLSWSDQIVWVPK